MIDRPTPETDALAEKLIPIAEKITEFNAQSIIKQLLTEILTKTTKLERERDEARDALMKIEEIYIDSDNTYDDWKAMGDVARKAVERWI